MRNLLALLTFVCFVTIGANAQTETEETTAPKTEQVKTDAGKAKAKGCCAGKAKSASCDKSKAAAKAGKGEVKACCAAKAKEGKACCVKKGQAEASKEMKPHVCTDACTKDKHKLACGEEGHECSEACKTAEK